METGLLADLSLGPWGISVALAMALAMLVLAVLSVRSRILTPPAAAASAMVGMVLLALGGIPYLAVILFFVLEGAIVTRFHFQDKEQRKVAEGRQGERGVSNVLAHVIVPLALVLPLPFLSSGPLTESVPFLYTSAIAFGAADTSASEIGVLSLNPVSILGFEKVKPGTNGGISGLGEFAALFASTLTALFSLGVFLWLGIPLSIESFGWVVGIALLGWLGCQVDSLLGATLENRGWLGKSSVNLFSMLGTVALGALLLIALPLLPAH